MQILGSTVSPTSAVTAEEGAGTWLTFATRKKSPVMLSLWLLSPSLNPSSSPTHASASTEGTRGRGGTQGCLAVPVHRGFSCCCPRFEVLPGAQLGECNRGEANCAGAALSVQGCACPQATEGDRLRKRKAAGALAAAGEHCLFHLTIVLCVAGRDLLFHKFGWKGELGRALGSREGFTAALAALCSPCRAGAPAEMP